VRLYDAMSCCTNNDNMWLVKRDEKRRFDLKRCLVCGKEYLMLWAVDWQPPTKKIPPNLIEINGRYIDRGGKDI